LFERLQIPNDFPSITHDLRRLEQGSIKLKRTHEANYVVKGKANFRHYLEWSKQRASKTQ